jgi:hypothetical protein
LLCHSLGPPIVRVRVALRLAVYRQSVPLGAEPFETHGQKCFSQLNTCCHSPYITSSLTRGWVCHLQLLLALASAFILGSESRGTRNHNLLSQIRDFPFCRLLRLVGLRWRYSTPPPHGNGQTPLWQTALRFITFGSPLVKVKVRLRPTVSLPICLGVKHLYEAYDQIFIAVKTVASLLIWGALSDERTGLPFTIAAGPRQRSHSWVRFPRDS